MLPRADVHQHLWSEPLLDALAARDRLPYVSRTSGTVVVHCAGERGYTIDLGNENPALRARLVRDDGLDLALVAPSSPIGLEALPRPEALELIDAHLTGIEQAGEEFAAWGPVALDEPDPDDVDALLARGCIGVSVPAGALAVPDALAELHPLLARAAERGAPVFVHPGPGRHHRARESSLTEPLWWSALTDYVAQMQAAWLSFATVARREHPRLLVLFAMLAGGAPLHAERLSARGAPSIDLRDPFTFYETSSYGPVAIEAAARCVGSEQLLYGSDRPVVEPARTDWDVSLQNQAGRLIAAITETAAPA
jgi:6-methylsalicylate decarboxylase